MDQHWWRTLARLPLSIDANDPGELIGVMDAADCIASLPKGLS